MIVHSRSEQDTERAGTWLAERLCPGAVVALYGGLGAGKTAFVRGMARGMGITSRVSSPTFTIVNEYHGDTPLFHFDMYRIGSVDELFEIGWEDYLERGGVCAVEWSENVSSELPPEAVAVTIEKLSDCERMIRITGVDIDENTGF